MRRGGVTVSLTTLVTLRSLPYLLCLCRYRYIYRNVLFTYSVHSQYREGPSVRHSLYFHEEVMSMSKKQLPFVAAVHIRFAAMSQNAVQDRAFTR